MIGLRFGLAEGKASIGLSYALNVFSDAISGDSPSQIVEKDAPGMQINRTLNLLGKAVTNAYWGALTRTGDYLGGKSYDYIHQDAKASVSRTPTAAMAAQKANTKQMEKPASPTLSKTVNVSTPTRQQQLTQVDRKSVV